MTIESVTFGSSETALLAATRPVAIVLMAFCNTSLTESQSITVHIRKSGAPALSSNVFLKKVAIDPEDTMLVNQEKVLLDSGDILSAIVEEGTGTISTTISYINI